MVSCPLLVTEFQFLELQYLYGPEVQSGVDAVVYTDLATKESMEM
jgi:hypothetical protein